MIGWFSASHALDCLDHLAVTFDGEGHAGKYGPSVHDDGARTAGTPVTHQLRAGKADPVVDHVVERPFRLDLHLVMLAVYGKGHGSRRSGKGLTAMGLQ